MSTSLLFNEKISTIYPIIGLSGGKDKGFQNNPYLEFGIVGFQKETVWVSTIMFDEIMDINITMFNGIPRVSELVIGTVCINGFIEVGKSGITIAAGARPAAHIKWPVGLTAVLVVLDADEVKNRTVKSVTFYLKHFASKWTFLKY